jgi:predicted dehydrogenase
MYVTGRKGSGTGTVLSSLAETSKEMDIEEVVVIARNPENKPIVSDVMTRINKTIGSALKVIYKPISGHPDIDIPEICRERSYDCAIVAIPDHLHFSYTYELLKCGIHCLVVKPFTATLAEAKELVKLQTERGLYGAVEFHKRFDETNLYIKKALSESKLGKILYFTVDYSQRITIPSSIFKGWSARTNIFQYLGVHYADLIYFLTGFIPVKAMAIGTTGILKASGINSFDSIHAAIIWKNPSDESDWFVSQFSTNWVDPACTSALSDQKYKVIGTKGRIDCDQKNRGVELVHEELGIQQINPYFSDYLPDENGKLGFGGYGHKSLALFVKDVKELKQNKAIYDRLERCRPTFKQALVSTAVIDAVNQSLEDNFSWKEVL